MGLIVPFLLELLEAQRVPGARQRRRRWRWRTKKPRAAVKAWRGGTSADQAVLPGPGPTPHARSARVTNRAGVANGPHYRTNAARLIAYAAGLHTRSAACVDARDLAGWCNAAVYTTWPGTGNRGHRERSCNEERKAETAHHDLLLHNRQIGRTAAQRLWGSGVAGKKRLHFQDTVARIWRIGFRLRERGKRSHRKDVPTETAVRPA